MKEPKIILERYLKENDTVVVAVSGGPDSMCLLQLLLEYRKNNNIKIVCAHVNHQVRSESKSEELFVQRFCNLNNVVFELMRIDKYDQDNFHQDARNKRYQFFENLIDKYHAKYLLTAHHGDDLIESILMRIVRGSTVRGYAGFESVSERESYIILRPLISETKDSILEYNVQNKIEYVTDASNLKDVYTRNRYRKYILPQLKKEDVFVHHKFKKYSDSLLEMDFYVKRQVESVIKDLYIDKKLGLKSFISLDSFIQKRVMQFILEDIYKDDIYLVTDKHTDLILDLALSSKTNGYINMPLNKTFLKDRNFLIFDVFSKNEEYSYIFQRKQELPNHHSIEVVENSKENTNFFCRLKSSDIQLPLIIRTRKNGDAMCVKHMTGTKKINDIFTDCKVPLLEREIWPIVTDSTGKIVWLPGLKKSNFDIEKDEKCDIILRYY